jgi:hypothetical protein
LKILGVSRRFLIALLDFEHVHYDVDVVTILEPKEELSPGAMLAAQHQAAAAATAYAQPPMMKKMAPPVDPAAPVDPVDPAL